MKRWIFFLVLGGILLLGGVFVFRHRGTNIESGDTGKISIVTTLFPLYDFAREVGGDRVDVMLLLPPGVESHAFEPTPNDIVSIDSADVFVFTGKIMEPWVEDIVSGARDRGVRIVDASDGIALHPGVPHDTDEPVGSLDPHIWLDFENDQKIADAIAGALSEADPANAVRYRDNAESYKKRLLALDALYRESLARCAVRTLVYGGHYAFGYLADRYGLDSVSAQGLSPDAEPSARDLATLVDQVRDDSIKYIFYEELSSPKIAETIAKETGAQLLLLNAAHNISKEDVSRNVSFLSLMEENRKNLMEGLECEQGDL